MKCPESHLEFPENFQFCEKCGKRLIPAEIPYVQRMPADFLQHPPKKDEDTSLQEFFKSEPKNPFGNPKVRTKIRSVRD